MKRAIFIMLLLIMEINSFPQNLVDNPGFEDWEKLNKPAGWSHVENSLKDSIFIISGKYSCMHSGGATSTSDLGQMIPVTPGNEYSLSLNNKTTITASGNGSRIWCYWKDSEGNSLSDPLTDAVLRPSVYFKNDTWQTYSFSITAPEEAAAFYLEVRTYPNSLAYWDDFIFEETYATSVSERFPYSLKIFPNPVSNVLTISSLQSIHFIDIQSITGEKISRTRFGGENTVTLQVGTLPDGLYILFITTSENIIIRKFIKQTY